MIFSYKKILGPGFKITNKRPVVTINVYGPKGTRRVEALLDTGADWSIFDMEIGTDIGFKFSTAKTQYVGGIGKDKVLVYTTNGEIMIPGINKKIKIPVGFMEKPNIPALLGQEGFFDAFKITFDRKKDIILLEKN